MTNTARNDFDSAYIEQLLPWYVTGKLEASERLEVEAALKRFPELRAQLDLIQAEMAGTVKLNEAMAMPQADATERFMDLVQKDMQRPAPAKPQPFKGLLDWLTLQLAGPPRWAVAAAVLAIVVQAALIGGLVVERQEGGFHTAGGGETRSEGTLVLARFSDGVTLAVLTERLAAQGITIVDGPKAGGLFTLRIGPDGMSVAERDKKIADLKANADFVVFVGPVQ
jgi:anti-sigma factor RsiW